MFMQDTNRRYPVLLACFSLPAELLEKVVDSLSLFRPTTCLARVLVART